MGWARLLLLGDLGQRLDTHDQQRQIENLRAELRRGRQSSGGASLAQLRAENDGLRLCVAALMRRLIAKGVITRKELSGPVRAVAQRSPPPL
ncbi:MAG TPA: hypothetical protein P5137_07000 [Candidatus Brocadiia bacterium]|nr:hypothetical protein [Candidatus Brocadiia bacterium]